MDYNIYNLEMMADPPEPEPEPGVDKMTVANSCLLATVTIVLVAMLVVTYKVFKIVRFGDLKMLLMLIFLDLALVGKGIIITSLTLP
jgi:hypothetical protein